MSEPLNLERLGEHISRVLREDLLSVGEDSSPESNRVDSQLDPGSYLVSLPVNLRSKGRAVLVFPTRISMPQLQLIPEVVGEPT